jgi:hypothetical protein
MHQSRGRVAADGKCEQVQHLHAVRQGRIHAEISRKSVGVAPQVHEAEMIRHPVRAYFRSDGLAEIKHSVCHPGDSEYYSDASRNRAERRRLQTAQPFQLKQKQNE